MNNKILIYLSFLLLIINNIAIGNDNLQKAEEAINHAATYHWLARYKNNDANDLLKSKKYFSQALTFLNKTDTTHYTKLLRDKAQSGEVDTDIRYENCFDNINNEYPLFNVLWGDNKTYELYDSPDVTAATYALEDAVSVIPLPIKNDFQYDVIVLSDPVNYELEDEIRVLLNAYPQFFPRPVEDILDIITKDEYDKLYRDNFSKDILSKLSEHWNKDDLLIAKLVSNDHVNDVSYLGIYLYEWNKGMNKITRSVYADGLVEDRLSYNGNSIIWFVLLLTISFVLSWLINKISFFKNEKDIRPVYLWTGTYSFIISIIVISGFIHLIQPIAPDPTSLAILPYPKIWIVLFHLFVVIFPIVLMYFISVTTPKLNERVHDGETLASLLGGLGLGMLFLFSNYYMMVFPENSINHYIITMCLLSLIFSVWVGHSLSKFLLHDKKIELIPLLSMYFIFVITVYAIMTNTFSSLYIADISLAVFPLLFYGYKNYQNRKISNEDQFNDIKSTTLNIRRLLELIDEPEVFIPSSQGYIEEQVEHFKKYFDKPGKLNVIMIEGEQGLGKTRLAKQIAKESLEAYNEINPDSKGQNNWILFGDCDELNQEGSGVPYEPFSQALHEILGAGRFEPPTKKANKIKAGLSSTGLGNILDIGGLGVLNVILDSQGDETKPASISEMVQVIISTLNGLSKERPVFFIIDDLHWIDPITNSLFEQLIEKLSIEEVKNIYFIFTSREINKTAQSGQQQSFLDPMAFVKNNEMINLSKVIKMQNCNYSETFVNILIDSLHFEKSSAQKYIKYVNKYDVTNILTFLQTIKMLIDDNGIKIVNNKVIIDKYDFNALKPPADIQTIIEEQLQSLTENQLRIVKFASFIGREFKASILSDALKIRRLHVLYDLEILEEKNIIEDVRAQDDVYKFSSNAIMNVLRFMAKVSEKESGNIPQIVREYHYRVANSIQANIQVDVNEKLLINDQELYGLAKRAWAAGDRMLTDAFKYNYEALKRTFAQLRYEESIVFGNNLITIIDHAEDKDQVIDIIRINLLIAQSKINLGQDSKGIDDIVEKMKELVEGSDKIEHETWGLIILNLEADALIHDHSGYFENQKKKILADIEKIMNSSSANSQIPRFIRIYAQLSQIRLNDNVESEEIQYEKILLLLNEVRNTKVDENEHTEVPLSGFQNNPEIDYKVLESEILEELIHVMFKLKLDMEKIIKYLNECEMIKLSDNIHDSEGLALVYNYLGKIYSEKGEDDIAVKYFQKTVSTAKKIGNDNWESHGRIGLAQILLKSNDSAAAVEEYEKIQKLKIENDLDIKNGCENLQNLISEAN